MPTAPRYDLIAIDLDGTLIDPEGRIPRANIDALAAARTAGVCVTICTGRALIECHDIIATVTQTDPCIVSGGAMVACPTTRATLERFTIEPALVEQVVDHLYEVDHPALLLKDPHATGYDYLIVTPHGPDAIDAASKTWFKRFGIRTRYVPFLEDDEHPNDTVRIGAYSANEPIDTLADGLRKRFAAKAQLQHFRGVQLPRRLREEEGIESIHIVEVFHEHADKWMALERLAKRRGVPLERTVAIGDQHNDLTMLTHAGLGIAMGNAPPEVAAAADKRTLSSEEGGVAFALERVLSGEW
jgi:Cof subfamily protein (haloacid dehalogenase superfamily)